MTRFAKTDDKNVTLRYFVEEQIVATPSLLIALAALAAIGTGDVLMDLRHGFTDVPRSEIVVPADDGRRVLRCSLCLHNLDFPGPSRKHLLCPDALWLQHAPLEWLQLGC